VVESGVMSFVGKLHVRLRNCEDSVLLLTKLAACDSLQTLRGVGEMMTKSNDKQNEEFVILCCCCFGVEG
jgi:hypothetical protein